MRVAMTRTARAHLHSIYHYIAERTGPATARRFTRDIVTHVRGFTIFPFRGTARDDIAPGLRTVGFRRRVVIAFSVDVDVIRISGILYGGRDTEAQLREVDFSVD